MITKIQKWGNSQGIRFSKEILNKAHIAIGDDVEVSFDSGQIVVKPASVVRGKYKLKNLLSEMPDKCKSKEIDWGKPSGGEVW